MMLSSARPLMTLSHATNTVARRAVAAAQSDLRLFVSDSSSFTLSRYPIRNSSSLSSSSFTSFPSLTSRTVTNHSPSSPSRLIPSRTKMTGPNSPPNATPAAAEGTTPAIPNQQQQQAADPVYSRAHPFLRKFQSTVNKVIAQQKLQQNQAGASAFSTKTGTVDEAIASVAAANPKIRSSSPTAAAASATNAIFNKRLSQNNLEQATAGVPDHTAHGVGCGCSGHAAPKSIAEMDLAFSDGDGDTRIELSALPPISDEARRFTEKLLGQNKAWAKKTEHDRPGFFAKLELQQTPQVLWIGCSDSRVPANQIVNLDPGEIFVHRNIANVVTHTDMNLLSVLEYAVDVLKVRHIIICGHYGCGGVAASLTQKQFGIIDNWLRNIKDLYTIHRKKFDTLPPGGKEQQDLLTELNVIQSALNVSHTSIIQKAWARGAELSVHGWCYRLSDGVIRDLGLCIEGPGNVEDVYHVMDEVKSSH